MKYPLLVLIIISNINDALAGITKIDKLTGENIDSINVTAYGWQVYGTKRIKADVTAITSIKETATYYSYSKVAYKLACPHSAPTEIYNHGKDANRSHFLEIDYKTFASYQTDDTTVAQGYPMASEYRWLQSQASNTTSICKLEYQGLAIFETFPFSISLSDLLPIGASVSLPSSHKRTELKNHLVKMRLPTSTSGGSGECIAHCTPIIIDLEQNGIHLGPANIGVQFDLENSGFNQQYQWVQVNGDEAFLVHDKNNNGKIDNGGELFGSGTFMVYDNGVYRTYEQIYAPNGFIALAQYDQIALGGNDDGIISSEDEIWPELQLWLDKNANGKTDSRELMPLKNFNIQYLETIPNVTTKTDPAGNGHYLWAWAYNNRYQKHKMVDVFFKRL